MAPALRHSGALGLAGFGGILGAGAMFVELQQARRAIPERTDAPFADGDFGPEDGRPLRLVLMGDSSAAGVGCETSAQTPGALLAQELVDRGFRVHLDVVAVSGARSMDLATQVARALLSPTDIAVICIGANDVTHFIAADVAAPLLGSAVLRLRAAGVAVLVATCPDLGAVRPVPQPMRRVGHHLCRRMSRLQAREVTLAGGVPVDIGRALGRAFRQGQDLFCPDRFHPSPLGYRALVDALVGPLDSLLPR
jgi:lysophospholipase L1-like esterase